MERERRRTPRYVFIASAELFEEGTEVRVASRVSELSLHGCYLDMMNPFPTGTIVLLKIFAGEMTFQRGLNVMKRAGIWMNSRTHLGSPSWETTT